MSLITKFPDYNLQSKQTIIVRKIPQYNIPIYARLNDKRNNIRNNCIDIA